MFGYKPETSNRQPVVLYDKDNKAIDVSGIEELSSVKIDTGEIAGDLKLVKDNQGRLYGKYGEAWIPVKVDSEGRPIISQGPAGTEPWPVQLTDSEDLAQDVTVQGVTSELEEVTSELELVKAELQAIKANQLSGNQKVTLSDSEDLAQDVTVQGVTSELEEVTSELELVKAELQAIKANQLSGNQKVTLSGTIMELYGATIDERPPANSVPVGATYMAVNAQDVWQSNGNDWVVM